MPIVRFKCAALFHIQRGFLRAVLALALACVCLLGAGCGAIGAATPAETPAPTASATPESTRAPTPAPTETPVPTPEPVALTAFVPDPYGRQLIRVHTTIPEDSPIAIIDELVRLGTLPDIDYGRAIYFEVGDSYIKIKGEKRIPRHVARLDLSDRLVEAFNNMTQQEEQLCLQGLANTFLTHYSAETFLLTANGVKLMTNVREYESGLTFDQYAKTAREE